MWHVHCMIVFSVLYFTVFSYTKCVSLGLCPLESFSRINLLIHIRVNTCDTYHLYQKGYKIIHVLI